MVTTHENVAGANPGLLLAIAHEVTALMARPLPEGVEHQARRALLNTLATASAGTRHPGFQSIVDTAVLLSGPGNTGMPGAIEQLSPYWAALATGFAAHVDDFDDTHLATVVHTSASLLGAAVGAAGVKAAQSTSLHGGGQRSHGDDSLRAFAISIEVELRIATALGEAHYDAGWHITGTAGVIGTAVMAGLSLGLSPADLAGAMGVAASSTLGTREAFGSDCKPFHPGKAAGNGLLASLVAMNGMRSSDFALEGPRGYLRVLSDLPDESEVLDRIGEKWHILDLTFKPYPCGIVAHPAIDAAVKLHSLIGGERISQVKVRCHPLVVELMGDPNPMTGLQARFSTIHGVAAGLLDGSFDVTHVTDSVARRQDVVELRERILLEPDAGIGRSEALVDVRCESGREFSETVSQARGSIEKPLSDEEIRAKAIGLLSMNLASDTVAKVLEGFDSLLEHDSIVPLIRSAYSSENREEPITYLAQGEPPLSSGAGHAQDPNAVPESHGQAIPVTELLCRFALDFSLADAPENVRHAGRRMIANALTVGTAGAGDANIAGVGAGLRTLGTRPFASVFGSDQRIDGPWAALINGMAVHIGDFDDTHLAADTHLSATIVPAALAAAEINGASGKEVLEAVIVGSEVALRVALGIVPDHFSRGWHVTGTVGHIGAAVAAGKVLGLDFDLLRSAIGIAATQAAGLQAAFGSSTKSWHAGKAAADGLEAAFLAMNGFGGPAKPIEGRRGFANTYSKKPDFERMVAALGSEWEIQYNTFKPYACGLLAHPAIDAARAIREQLKRDEIEAIAEVTIGVYPAVLDVMGISEPTTGLQGKFSVYHCFAVALLDGICSPAQFLDQRVLSPDVVNIRRMVNAQIDGSLAKDATWVKVRMSDGREFTTRVEHAFGSVHFPLSDDDLRDKAVQLLGSEFGSEVEELMSLCLHVQDLETVSPLFGATRAFGPRGMTS